MDFQENIPATAVTAQGNTNESKNLSRKNSSRLTAAHEQHLLDEGFTREEIKAWVRDCNVRSLTKNEAFQAGFKCWDGEEWRSSSGILFSFSEEFGQLRADTPIPRKHGKPAKYITQACRKTEAWIPKGCQAVTEGFKDAAMATFRGVPTGGIAGVSHYRKALPEGCGYAVVFDSDGWTNEQVFRNLVKAGIWTKGKVLILPPIESHPKGGICELYKSGDELDLSQAIKPVNLLLDWPNHWDELSGAQVAKLAKTAVQLAAELLPEDECEAFINRIAAQHHSAGLRSRTLVRIKYKTLKKITGDSLSHYKKDYNTILSALGSRLAYNEVTQRFELDGKVLSPDEIRPTLEIDFELGLKSRSKEPFIEIVQRIAKSNSYNPIQNYLTAVYSKYKDQPELLQRTADTLASTYLGTTEDNFDTLLIKTLISAIARTFKPGCKVDTSTVLVGPQGSLKSTFWKVLASPEYFCDDFYNPSDKDHVLKLHECWFVEWSELHGLTRREVTQTKQFMATGRDLIRPPYGRSTDWMPRPSILVGTSNESDFLTDATGNRRWWVIETKKIDIEAVEQNRDLIWAAAMHSYLNDEPWWADPELEKKLENGRKAYQKEDAWHDAISNYVEKRKKVSVAEIFDCVLKMEVGRRTNSDSGRITKILKMLGFSSLPNPISHQYLNGLEGPVSSKQRVWEKQIEHPEREPKRERVRLVKGLSDSNATYPVGLIGNIVDESRGLVQVLFDGIDRVVSVFRADIEVVNGA